MALFFKDDSAGIYLFKAISRNTTTRYEICSKLTIKTQDRLRDVFWCCYEHASHLVLVFLLLALYM